ncbi:hypothetical protein [Tenggerimyces flavus]|uniref:Uncharacterized protein n=1 Tax=Tenggerimyces flavus TaxID=1708749 RepID=A0ABV7YCV0_9ACTN|nr:hypothetical protein [Tenggerimyces flavus]MBM7787988.1 hypothetical protein [Tenggerimyces flavus]
MVGLLRTPFTPYVWRRFAYALLAPLVGLFALGLALSGRYGAAGHLQRALVRTLLQVPLDEPQPAGNGAHPLLHTVVALPLSVATFFLTTYALTGLVLNVAYPVRVDGFPFDLPGLFTPSHALDGAWGGPTLAGAWAFHGVVGGLLFVYAGSAIVCGLVMLQSRLAGKLLATKEVRTRVFV